MKVLRIFLAVFILSFILSGCISQNPGIAVDSPQQNKGNNADEGNDLIVKELVKLTGNEEMFVQNSAKGSELWFDKWHFHNDSTDENFVINGETYNSGLGYDGNTVEGLDKRGFAFVEYGITSGKYDELTGIFAFDDKTKVKPDSKLSVTVNDAVVYESEPINENKTSMKITVPLGEGAKTIGFKFETEIKSDSIPKIVFADIRLQKSE